jgi:hypothetical protein
MATTLAQVGEFLDRRGWRYHQEPERDRIITGVNSEHASETGFLRQSLHPHRDLVKKPGFLLVIQLQEDEVDEKPGFCDNLCILTETWLRNPVSLVKGVAFQTMLAIAWEVKLLRWEYDPSDGEVRTSVGVALEDAPLTERQFDRLLSALIDLTERGITSS